MGTKKEIKNTKVLVASKAIDGVSSMISTMKKAACKVKPIKNAKNWLLIDYTSPSMTPLGKYLNLLYRRHTVIR